MSPSPPEHTTTVIDERDRFYTSQISALKGLIDERDRLYDSRFKAAEVAVSAALAAQEKAVNAAFTASEKAVLKAEQAQKEYNERSNEFRGQLDDQAKTLMPRPETLTMFKALEEKLAATANGVDSKVNAVQANGRSELGTFQRSYEQAHTAIEAQIIALRESISLGNGKDIAKRDNTTQSNWTVGIVVAVILGLLQVVLHFIK